MRPRNRHLLLLIMLGAAQGCDGLLVRPGERDTPEATPDPPSPPASAPDGGTWSLPPPWLRADAGKTDRAGETVAAGIGTGTSYGPSNIKNVTGGGPMPDWTGNVVTAACAGDGVKDDTACLQSAADAAKSQNRALVIPKTAAFYRTSRPIYISTSVGGVGGMPTIQQTNPAVYEDGEVMHLRPGMTGWIYNLHLAGTFTGTSINSEWAHTLTLGSVNGVTIKGNLFENPMGDCIESGGARFDTGNHQANNVIVDSNTCRNPRRCAIALTYHAESWVITNNVFDKQVNYVSAIDYEPEGQGHVWSFEVAYNRFVMNNKVPVDPDRGSDGKAISSWLVPGNPLVGGNFHHHHNYGTFGTGFSTHGPGVSNVVETSNVEGQSPPP